MLFNSGIFIFVFLPVVLAGHFFVSGRLGHRALAGWLVLSSLFFYGYWNPIYLLLLMSSIVINFSIGQFLTRAAHRNNVVLALGIIFNLSVIGYFKYTNFLVDNFNAAFAEYGMRFNPGEIALPLGISFFTFQQIAYLVDAYRQEVHEYSFLNYCLFVSFFPQLIAGPIVHHSEMMPQFARVEGTGWDWDRVARGMSIFALGLCKKVVLADTVAVYATRVFGKAELPMQAASITFFEAWGGCLAYTYQLYFDFSGYSDMAIGLGLLIGIQLPVNFDSPYKASNIIDFWRRWHITLSRFLRTYLYFPLGGNRHGRILRYVNLSVTMLLGGLWHGASWNFVLWGGLHGLFLIVNHGWRALSLPAVENPHLRRVLGAAAVLLTFFVTSVAWVLFRAPTLRGAGNMYDAMFSLSALEFSASMSREAWMECIVIGGLGLIAFFGPNVKELFGLSDARVWPGYRRLVFRTSWVWAAAVTVAFASSVLLVLSHRVTEFLYFEF